MRLITEYIVYNISRDTKQLIVTESTWRRFPAHANALTGRNRSGCSIDWLQKVGGADSMTDSVLIVVHGRVRPPDFDWKIKETMIKPTLHEAGIRTGRFYDRELSLCIRHPWWFITYRRIFFTVTLFTWRRFALDSSSYAVDNYNFL